MRGKLLIVLLSLTFLVVFPGLAFAQFGSVSGKVTDEVTGLPIMGAHVWAGGYTSQPGGNGFDTTDSAGFYMIDGLLPRAFRVSAYAQGYQREDYPKSVIVVEGQNTPNMDFALTPVGGEFGSVSGRVTDEVSGYPIEEAAITLSGIYCVWYTDSTGYYMCDNIPPGAYEVNAYATGYYQETYPESVVVVEGQNTPDIDFALTPTGGGTGSISGMVTDEVTGRPIVGAGITLSDLDCDCMWFTDSTGHYICDYVPPGVYEVYASANGYYPETYPESVIVVEGQNTPHIDFALTPIAEYGSISGQVIDEQTGLPIIMARLRAIGLDNWCYGEAWSDTGGWYGIQHLCPGIYQVVASKEGYAPEVYPDSVIVVAEQNTPNINFALTPIAEYGSISGRVTDEETGLPISMAHLIAIGLDNWCYAEAWSDTDGYYIIPHLCPGIYQVNANAQGYIPETYPDSVIVIAGQNTPDIDFALTPVGEYGSISGRVTDEETGLPIIMAHLIAIGLDNWCYGEAWSDTGGYYMIQDLCAGTYQVNANAIGYVPETYPDSVIVIAGENTPDIDFALTPIGEAGSISGTITDANTGEPIPGAHIWAHGEFGHGQAFTDSLGEYTIYGLYAGSYFVTAWAWDYYPQDYPTVVTVIEGQDTPGIDFALIPYGGPGEGIIAGMVLEDTTFLLPIPYAIVFAISFNGNWGFDFTDSVGAYMIQGLQTDDYYVFAIAPGYIGEFYDGVYTWEEATLVTPDAYDVDFYLAPCGSGGGRISGVINSDGSPLEGALVYAQADGEVKGFARSSSEGGYVINGLLPGTYTVSASKVSYHDGSYPEPVEVGSGKVSGIDIELPPVQVGDVTGEGLIDIGDVLYLTNYLYKNGFAPDPLPVGDTNCDGIVDIGDVLHLINYLYKGGPTPGC